MTIKVRDGSVEIRKQDELVGGIMLTITPDRLDELLAACLEAKGVPKPGDVWESEDGKCSRRIVRTVTHLRGQTVDFEETMIGLNNGEFNNYPLSPFLYWVRETNARRVG